MDSPLDGLFLLIALAMIGGYIWAVKKDYQTSTAGAIFRVILFIAAIFFVIWLIMMSSH